MQVEVIYSPRRKKTLSAHTEGEKLIIRTPVAISEKKLKKSIEVFKGHFRAKKLNRQKKLKTRAEKINKKYFGGKIKFKDIKFVVNQHHLWGSCASAGKAIRVSSRLINVPDWVLDYVIVHELVHVKEPNHSKHFWDLVNRYELAERARGYLMALGSREV